MLVSARHLAYNSGVMANDILPPITEDDRMLSGLVYPLWPLIGPIILYGSKREEPYLHFNALQAIALGGGSLGAGLLVFIVCSLIFYLLPGSFITFSALVGLGLFGVVVFALVFYVTLVIFIAWRVANGKFLRLPFIGTWAEKRMQTALNLSPESYSSAVFGERLKKGKLSQFDYRSAPGYREEDDIEYGKASDDDEAHYNPDTENYEYTSDASSVEDIISYGPEAAEAEAQSGAPAASGGFKPGVPSAPGGPGGFKPGVPSAPGGPGGFKPGVPSAPGGPGGFKPSVPGVPAASGGFKPGVPSAPAASGGFKPGVPSAPAARSNGAPSFGNMTNIDKGGFKPLTPQNKRAPEPVVAGRPAQGEFKPLVPGAPPKPKNGAPPQFKWANDFSSSKPSAPQAEEAPQGEFKPGLTPSKPAPKGPVSQRFRWDELENK